MGTFGVDGRERQRLWRANNELLEPLEVVLVEGVLSESVRVGFLLAAGLPVVDSLVAVLLAGVFLTGALLARALWVVGFLMGIVGTLGRGLREVADTAMLNTLLLCVAVTSHIGWLAFGDGG